MLYGLLKPILFALPPEQAHHLILETARLAPFLGELTGLHLERKYSVQIGQVTWSFPLGLAAGLDKNAEALRFFSAQGFGALECGTITLKPQLGNPLPRMFRYPSEESLRNAMGFPNHGLVEILSQLRRYDGSIPLGANIGKNKDSTPEESIEELSILFETLHDVVSYFVINVSSPNTPGLRAMQERSYLAELFQTLKERRRGKDLYLKIAPDLTAEKILELKAIALDHNLTGIIATNTTMMPERGAGGVSGKLLKEKSLVVRELLLKEETALEIIAVGGISTPDDLKAHWALGGKAAQAYTAYVYQGPALLKKTKSWIDEFLKLQNCPDLPTFMNLSREERMYRCRL
jgi:dihydroorotate dehydrogenase